MKLEPLDASLQRIDMALTLFGTDGIRGTANEYPITPEIALRTGRAIARALKSDNLKVLIGKDTRESGAMLEAALISGLVSEGATVFLGGQAPTPAISLMTEATGCSAGVMLTASHNPYQDNGIKIFGPDGYKLSDALEAEVERLILSDETSTPPANQPLGQVMQMPDVSARYLEFLQTSVGETSLKGKKVVLDCANGAGYVVGPVIFQALGAEVISMGIEPNGKNINADVGSLHPDKAAELVKKHNADVGICLDGDADRVIFIDHKGNEVSGDRTLCLFALAQKEQGLLKNETLVSTVMSNLGLRDALQNAGITLETTSVGDRHVLQRMHDGNFNLGGENSGHIIFTDHANTGDGILSGLQLLKIIVDSDKSLAELSACMDEYPSILTNIMVTDKPIISDVPELVTAIETAEAAFGEKGRILVRYSGTEKKIRILVEAQDAQLAEEQSQLLQAAVHNTIGA